MERDSRKPKIVQMKDGLELHDHPLIKAALDPKTEFVKIGLIFVHGVLDRLEINGTVKIGRN